MGTRSLTHVNNSAGETFFTFYKQHDGYPEGWGKELAEFLSGFQIVNGLSRDTGKIANGMGCLAAQIIAHFKEEPGQFYIYPAGSKDCGEEFTYIVKLGEEKMTQGTFPRPYHGLKLTCNDGERDLFDDTPENFAAFLAKAESE